MNMKRISTLIAGIVCSICLAYAAGPDAATILSKMKARVNAAPSLEAVFSINGGDGPVEGNAVIAGDKYTMHTPHLKVWFDGRTQWTYLLSSGEVSVTEPDADELMASNPFAILSAHSDFYRSKRLPDSQNRYRVQLTPASAGSGIERIVLFVHRTSWMPSAIAIHFDDGRSIDVVIDNITTGAAKPVSTFRFDRAKYPAVQEIIDLR